MKAIKFDGELTDINTSKLLEDIDKYSKDEEIIIYFCSNGGGVTNGSILSDYLNRNDYERFTIIVDWECSSAAFSILVNLKCKVIINDSAFAILHKQSNKLEYARLADKKSIDSFLKDQLEKDNDKELKDFILAGLTQEETEIYKSGNDIIISGERMRILLNNLKAIRTIK